MLVDTQKKKKCEDHTANNKIMLEYLICSILVLKFHLASLCIVVKNKLLCIIMTISKSISDLLK